MKFIIKEWLNHTYTIALLCNNTNLFPKAIKTTECKVFNTKDIITCIKNHISITIEEYTTILIQLNAKKFCNLHYFENKEDIKKP